MRRASVRHRSPAHPYHPYIPLEQRAAYRRIMQLLTRYPAARQTAWTASSRAALLRVLRTLRQEGWQIAATRRHVVILTHAAHPDVGIVLGKQAAPRVPHAWTPVVFTTFFSAAAPPSSPTQKG
jgi:hypothetical protein